MMHNKRRQNNGGSGNGGGQQNRHHNNRPRRFGGGGGQRSDDSMNVARARRNATQAREKYQNMARDAMAIGDRVLAENWLQHADHYYRILLSLPPEEVRQPQQRSQNEDGASITESGDENAVSATETTNVDPGQITTTNALPAFITQPVASDPVAQDNLHE